eukprot:TRINITY_DN105626_c0_g1_i1.p1 TRINITY_DN105626_c0_g1~~TRINITY_DN105626_c0_g1_i1.p1  ORF type:complete len:406 (+),score=92.78 TRINITY_DN105626_c0_g1_i1:40-1218(+)
MASPAPSSARWYGAAPAGYELPLHPRAASHRFSKLPAGASWQRQASPRPCSDAAAACSGRWLLCTAAVCLTSAARSRRTGRRAAGERGDSSVAVETKPEESEEEDAPFFEEVSGDDPLVLELEERLKKMNDNKDLTLDMVLNPGTIVNTEREIVLLKAELKATPEEETTKRKELEDKIEAKQMKVVNEMRQVMTDSLKLEFLAQAILSIVAFGAMCYNVFPWVPDLTWAGVNRAGSELGLKLFGVWGIWLVTVPALRARKPGGPYGMGYEEKRALDLSFLVLPFVCIFMPFVSKDPASTFWADLLILAALYVWSFNTPLAAEGSIKRGAGQDLNLPEPVMWALKALDFGTGSERGERSEDTTWKEQLAQYEAAAEELAAKKQKRAETTAGSS